MSGGYALRVSDGDHDVIRMGERAADPVQARSEGSGKPGPAPASAAGRIDSACGGPAGGRDLACWAITRPWSPGPGPGGCPRNLSSSFLLRYVAAAIRGPH
jgi:hypothetical protein